MDSEQHCLPVGDRDSISALLRRSRESRDLRIAARALGSIVRQRRLLEAAYGAYCFLRHAPSPVFEVELPSGVHEAMQRIASNAPFVLPRDRAQVPVPFRETLPAVEFRCRPEAIAITAACFLAGEYTEHGARLVYASANRSLIIDHYARVAGVQHIHMVQALSETRFLVSTGDTTKRLDVWEVRDDRPVLLRSLRRRLGGHTAACRAGGATYLGTDFAERPNHLLRLDDRRRYMLPALAYRSYVDRMSCVDDRYVLAVCRHLPGYGAASFVVFDTRTERYLACGPLTPPDT